MALMTWNDGFSVGVKAMDEQHKVLVKMLNDLHEAMMSGQAKSVTGGLLKSLAKYTKEHFTAEEAIMMRAKYPQLVGHIGLHKDLNKQVEAYVNRFDRGEVALSVDLLTFLRDWLTTHILKQDREYGPWLNQHGVQ